MRKHLFMNLRIFDSGESSGGQGGSAGNGGGGQGSAGYTYEQVEEIANARAGRAERAAMADFFRKQGMTEEEVTEAINKHKAEQLANKPDVTGIAKERDDARKELEELKNTNLLRDMGVRPDDLDYVAFKVRKLVDDKTDFAKAAEKFLKENPRYTARGGYRVTTSAATGDQSDGGNNANGSINDAIRRAMRR